MILPSLALAVSLNEAVRDEEEAREPGDDDDLDRVAGALDRISELDDPVEAAARLIFHVTFAHGFFEGDKRTALLLGAWMLDANTVGGAVALMREPDDELGHLLLRAARGVDVESEMVRLLRSRIPTGDTE